MAVTTAGMMLLDGTRPDVARLLITAVAVGAFVAVLLTKQPEGHRPGRGAVTATGGASGLLTGFEAMLGPPVVPFLPPLPLQPQTAAPSTPPTCFLIRPS